MDRLVEPNCQSVTRILQYTVYFLLNVIMICEVRMLLYLQPTFKKNDFLIVSAQTVYLNFNFFIMSKIIHHSHVLLLIPNH